MKIYLAARYGRRDEVREIRDELLALGHEVVSRWLDTDSDNNDMEDLLSADCLISFAEEPSSPHGRGGRHVEFGAALQAGKRLLVVGYRENVFHHHPRVEFFADTQSMLEHLKHRSAVEQYEIPAKCQLCGIPILDVYIDGLTVDGPKLKMCVWCHDAAGCGIGGWRGQEYRLIDGVWQGCHETRTEDR